MKALYRSLAASLLACTSSLTFAVEDAPAPAVSVAAVHAEMLKPTRTLQGSVVAAQSAALAARRDARVTFVAALGAAVKQGEVLARLDDDQARLSVARERTRIARLDAELALAQRQSARLSAVSDAIPAAQRDEAQARGQVLGAQLAEARVALQMAQLDLDQTQVRAPFAGVVVERLRQDGEYARVGEPLLRLVDVGSLEVDLAVPVELAGFVRPGESLTVAMGSDSISAPLKALVPGAAETRQLRARLSLPPHTQAPIGAALSIDWPAATEAVALTVPMDAVIRRSEGLHLLRVNDGLVKRIPITLGTRSRDRVAVIGELHPGDQIVIRGGERLGDGAKVSVLPERVVAGVSAVESDPS